MGTCGLMHALVLLSVQMCCLVAGNRRIRGAPGLKVTYGSHSNSVGFANGNGEGEREGASKARSAIKNIASSMLNSKGNIPRLHEIMRTVSKSMRVHEALHHLRRHQMPPDVALALQQSTSVSSRAPLSEESMSKARKYLNDLLQKARGQVDEKIMECKDFDDKTQVSLDQASTDMARLGEQLADFQRLKVEANEGINTMEQEINDAEERRRQSVQEYGNSWMKLQKELKAHQQDASVFGFLLEISKCTVAGASLIQVGERPGLQVCDSETGLTFSFTDPAAQKRLSHMTPRARRALRRLFGLLHTRKSADGSGRFIQMNMTVSSGIAQAPQPTTPPNNLTLSSSGNEPTTRTPVFERVPEHVGALRCSQMPTECGPMYDMLAWEFSKAQDAVDKIHAALAHSEDELRDFETQLNLQINIMRDSKVMYAQQLAEAVSNLNAGQEQAKEKEQEQRQLQHEYKQFMSQCKHSVEQILHNEMCSLTVIRNAVLKDSAVSPPDQIVDCEVSDWVADDCSVPCDDACTAKNNLLKCGGLQTLTRNIMVTPNDFGLRCPALQRQRKCNQFRCPVDCVMSEWSGFSKCTRECEGGVQERSRNVLTKPMHGGLPCNTVQEERPCHTESCNRDCTLETWTQWSSCSVACGGGLQEKRRRVLIPIHANGRCPKPSSPERLESKACNEHKCVGDEICISKQDLIVAIDASGSMTESGFGALKTLATKLVDRFQSNYYGTDRMRVGVVQFGNGEIQSGGLITGALKIVALTDKMDMVKTGIAGMVWKKGFTNMAQAFSIAKRMLQSNGRRTAQSTVLVLTDGQPMFVVQTRETVQQLEDNSIRRFFVLTSEHRSKEFELMRSFASHPQEANIALVAGLEILKSDPDAFVEQILTKLCPNSISPSERATLAVQQGYMLVKEGGVCGPIGQVLSRNAADAKECYVLAKRSGAQSFVMGRYFQTGFCYAMAAAVSSDTWAAWVSSVVAPQCPATSNKEFESNRMYSFYGMKPDN